MATSTYVDSSLRAISLSSAAFVLYCAVWIVYTRFFHPLRKVPGPFLASVTRYWLVSTTMKGQMHDVQRALHKKYGPLVRIAPDEVACADVQAIKVLYPTQNPLTKTEFYPIWGTDAFSKYPDLFTCIDEKLHASRRRIVNNIYSLSNVLQSEPHLDACSRVLIKQLGGLADSGKTVDMGDWLHWYAYDVIGQIYFGDMFGFMEGAHDHKSLIHSLETLLPFLMKAALSPVYLRPFILGFAMLSSNVRKGMKAVNHIPIEARSCVAARLEKGNTSPAGRDLLQQLLDIVDEKGSKVDFGLEEVQQEAWVGLFAGSDTTAIALRAIVFYLITNPTKYKKLEDELDEAERSNQFSEVVQYAEASCLPYLSACIKEAMRLHPSVGLTMPRISPAAGIEIAGTYIPAGYVAGMNPAVVHYDKSAFGDDAESFRPERWLTDDASVMEKSLLTFGAGTRTCSGKNISMAEIHKVIPDMLRHFHLELAPEADYRTENYWFTKQYGLKVKVTRRGSKVMAS